jgi:hypothetical protein
MTRLLLLGLLVVILRLAYKNFAGQLKAALTVGTLSPSKPPAPQQVAETLLQCSRCGTYVVSARALKGAGAGEAAVFCSEECRSSPD